MTDLRELRGSIAKPAAWLLAPIVQRNPARPMIRGCYTEPRTALDCEFAALDGDAYTELYAVSPAAILALLDRVEKAEAERDRARVLLVEAYVALQHHTLQTRPITSTNCAIERIAAELQHHTTRVERQETNE